MTVPKSPAIKLCGLREPAHLALAASLGVRFAGLVFYPASPRNLDLEAGAALSRAAPDSIELVALLVDPTDDLLHRIITEVKPHFLQLHGAETAQRVQTIKSRLSVRIIKALPVSDATDLACVADYEAVADWLLFDAKSPDMRPGGNGRVFDWTLLRGIRLKKPWMLSGGLTSGNVGAALNVLTPVAVDVSSGVETSPGVKDPDKIRAFVTAVRQPGSE